MTLWLLRLISLRRAVRSPLRSLLLFLSVALTVCLFVAVFHASRSAIDSFEQTSSRLTQGADIELRARTGYLTPDVYQPVVRKLSKKFTVVPLVELPFVLDEGKRSYPLVITGVDVFQVLPRDIVQEQRELLQYGVYLTRAFAQRVGLKKGDRISIAYHDKRESLVFLDFVDKDENDFAETTVLADVMLVHRLLGFEGLTSLHFRRRYPHLHKIDEIIRQLEAEHPDLIVASSSERRDQAESLVSAFRTNLLVMLGMTLVVMLGAVYGAAQLSALSLFQEISVLRALGLSKVRAFLLLGGETILVGISGAFSGALLGRPVSRLIAEMILGTAQAFYLPHQATALLPTHWDVQVIAVLIGSIGIVAGALLPLINRSQQLDATLAGGGHSDSETGRSVNSWILLGCGIGTFVLSAFASYRASHSQSLLLAYISCLLMFVAMMLAVPPAIRLVSKLLRRLGVSYAGVPGLIAWGYVESWQRVGRVSASLLTLAVALLCGLGILLRSFEHTLEEWVAVRFHADLFVRPRSTGTLHHPALLAPETVEKVQSIISEARFLKISRSNEEIEGRYVSLVGVDGAEGYYSFLSGGTSSLPYTALLSESASRHLAKKVGDTVEIRGDRYKVSGVYRDFTTERGEVVVSLPTFQKITSVYGIESISIDLPKGVDPLTVESQLRQTLESQAVRVASNRELKNLIRRLFRETFAITFIVRIAVALLCVAAFLLAVIQRAFERRADIGNLLRLGVSPLQFATSSLLEASLLLIPALLLGMGGGVYLAMLLVELINPLSFGWSLIFLVQRTDLLVPSFILGIAILGSGFVLVLGGFSLLGSSYFQEDL
jgi:putative ABC transport system permease protein